ncbi:tetratricopeptide repeat protein [Fluviicola sp.]|uniref:tetratricopeptide repeat protein n=1 Tax=Fluviicola sp. TaxID=1917219 RepID=UPI003D277787
MKYLLIGFLISCFGTVFAQNETYYNRVFDSVVARNEQKGGIAFFESELKNYPKNEFILRSLGALNLQLGNLKETKFYYEKALVVNPECAKCYFYIADAYASEQNLNAAYQAIEKGLSINSKEPLLYLLRGKFKLYEGNEIGGLNDLSKAILIDPNGIAYYMERGDYFLRKGNYFSAKRDFLKAQEIDPKNLNVYNYLAQIYAYENDYPSALSSINKAIEIDSTSTKSLLTRGEVYLIMEDSPNAIQDYQRVIRLDPENYHAYYYLAEAYYKQERMDDFCKEISKSIQLVQKEEQVDQAFYTYLLTHQQDVCDSLRSSYFYQRGIAQFNLEKPQEAISYYNRGIAKFPNEYMIYSFRGNAQLSLLKNREAISDYQKSLLHIDEVAQELLKSPNYVSVASRDSLGLAINAFKSSTYISLSFCYFNLDKTDSALSCIDLSITHQPNMKEYNVADAQFMRGILLMDKSRYEEAGKAFKLASDLSPEWSICKDYIALSLIAQVKSIPIYRNKFQIKTLIDLAEIHWNFSSKIVKESPYFNQALEYLESAIRINPSDYFAIYLRAYVNRQLGRSSACEDFKRPTKWDIR